MKQDSHLLSLASAAAAGALFMYYLDAKNGARRRALVRDKVVSTGHEAARRAQASSKHAADRVKGMAARVRTHMRADPEDTSGKPHATEPARDSWNEQGV